jgi:hypothetical protein
MGTKLSCQLSLLDQERLDRPSEPDDILVEAIAERTIEELAESPPVDLEVVAGFRGIDDIRREDLNSAGSLTAEEHGLVMRLRMTDSLQRQRFTGFHEVSHTFQPGYRDRILNRCAPNYQRRTGVLDEESLSDIGAAGLLLPAVHFKPDVVSSSFGVDSIIELASRYDASIQATTYRYAAFWPEEALVVVLEPGWRKGEDRGVTEPRLRVKHAWGLGRWPYLPPNKSANDTGVLAEALQSDAAIVAGNVDLGEFGVHSPEHLEVSAKRLPYFGSNGELIPRVVAIYRNKMRLREGNL